MPATQASPPVSVVIRARNEARYIGDTLAALFAAGSLAPRDTVVVDSGSTDGTQNIARRFPVQLVQITPEQFTYGFALNLGIACTSGSFIASLSAHSLPANADWLRNLLLPFQDQSVAAVYGRQRPRANATWPELLSMRLTGVLSAQPARLRSRPLFSNASGAFRRELWEVHPFDEMLPGAEDIAWVRTMQARGYTIAYEPSAVVYHSHGESVGQHLRRAGRDLPTVVGNVLHLGSGEPVRTPPRLADTALAPARQSED